MRTFEIVSAVTGQKFYKEFESAEDCRHWVINHLDLSNNWDIKDLGYYIY